VSGNIESERETYKREKYTNSYEEIDLTTPYLITTTLEWEPLIFHIRNHPTMEDRELLGYAFSIKPLQYEEKIPHNRDN
jgi:hypothetical protein